MPNRGVDYDEAFPLPLEGEISSCGISSATETAEVCPKREALLRVWRGALTG